MHDIGVGVYARRVLTSEDKILSITQRSGKRTVLQAARLYILFSTDYLEQ